MELQKHSTAEPAVLNIAGSSLRRLLNEPGHHPYFTNPAWFEAGKRVLVVGISDRCHIWSVSAEDTTEEPRLLAEFDPQPSDHSFHITLHDQRGEAFLWNGNHLVAVDLKRGGHRRLWQMPESLQPGSLNVSADGQHLLFQSQPVGPDRSFVEQFAAKLHCRIWRLNLNSLQAETVYEEKGWLGHVNPSPTVAHLLTYCQEGPWTQVESRVWAMDLSSGKRWKVRPSGGAPACIGHEFWLQDGIRIGFHGFNSKAEPIIGVVRVTDDSSPTSTHECVVDKGSMHVFSNDGIWFVGDGKKEYPYLLLYRLGKSGEVIKAVPVCYHRGTWPTQSLHVHPRFSPDGRSILFTTDTEAGGRPWLLTLPPDWMSQPGLPHA